MSKSSTTKPAHASTGTNIYKAAFKKTAPERAALDSMHLDPINLDIQGVVTAALGALPRLALLRDEVANLHDFDIRQFDKLKAYAHALGYAHTLYLAASTPAEPLPVLGARATELRERLLADATSLAKRDLLDGKRLAELKGGPGYLNICSDVAVLAEMFRERWSAVESKTPVQLSELDEGEKLYEQITDAYVARTQPSPTAIAAGDERQRAYTLLLAAYDQARRAVMYLRWDEGDVDTIIPSLWAGRGRRSSNAATASGAGATGTGVGNVTPAPGAVAITTPTPPPVATPAPPAVTNGAPQALPGLSLGSPFVHA